MRSGAILGFEVTMGSGLGTFLIEDDETGSPVSVACDAGQTLRSLSAAFGLDSYIGRRIRWECDEFGVMVGFEPEDEEEL